MTYVILGLYLIAVIVVLRERYREVEWNDKAKKAAEKSADKKNKKKMCELR